MFVVMPGRSPAFLLDFLCFAPWHKRLALSSPDTYEYNQHICMVPRRVGSQLQIPHERRSHSASGGVIIPQ